MKKYKEILKEAKFKVESDFKPLMDNKIKKLAKDFVEKNPEIKNTRDEEDFENGWAEEAINSVKDFSIKKWVKDNYNDLENIARDYYDSDVEDEDFVENWGWVAYRRTVAEALKMFL